MSNDGHFERIATRLTDRARLFLRGTSARFHHIITRRDGTGLLFIIAGSKSHIAHGPREQAESIKAIVELVEAGLIMPCGKNIWDLNSLGIAVAEALNEGKEDSFPMSPKGNPRPPVDE